METLFIEDKTTDEVVKEINKARLRNKNQWFQVEVFMEEYKYQFKIFNTWAQIGRKRWINTGQLVYNDPNCMDQKVSEFKEYLSKFIV